MSYLEPGSQALKRIAKPLVKIAFIGSILGGCDSGNNSMTNAVEPKTSSSVGFTAPANAEEALSFIQSRIHLQRFRMSPASERNTNALEVTQVSLTKAKWSWTAHLNVSDEQGSRPLYLAETYYVTPSDLAASVQVESNMVVLECRVGACLDIRSSYGRSDIPSTHRQSDGKAEKVGWLLDNADSAKRIANALNFVLPKLGAKQRNF